MLTNEQQIQAAERGEHWGKQEAGHQLEAVENGHRREPATWTTGQWCGDNPFSRTDDETADRDEYEDILDRAAQAAYEAAVEAAVIPEPMHFIFTAGRNEDIGDFMTYEAVNQRAADLAESWGEHVTVTERFDKSNTWVVEVAAQ